MPAGATNWSGSVREGVWQYARQAGTTGSTGATATGDYSTAAVSFIVAPATSETIRVIRMMVYLEDTGNKFIDDNYGAIASGLTNGVLVQHQGSTGNVIKDLTDGIGIKTNGQWKRTCFDRDKSDNASGSNNLGARWTFAKSGTPVRLEGSKGEKIAVVLNDSCTGLDDHTFMFQGYYESKVT